MKFDFQTMRRFFAMLAVMPMFALAVACGEDSTNDDKNPGDEPGNDSGTGGGSTEKYEEIKVVNEHVRV